jgi:hypothetical protein
MSKLPLGKVDVRMEWNGMRMRMRTTPATETERSLHSPLRMTYELPPRVDSGKEEENSGSEDVQEEEGQEEA